MKYSTRAQIYKASNVNFNPNNFQAHSYDWWRFVDMIDGKIVFNSYNYSPTTIKHQYKVRRLLSELGIKIDLEIDAPTGLQDGEIVANVRAHYKRRCDELNALINKPRTHKAKNQERLELMQALIVESEAFCKLFNAEKAA